jgi:lysophospholipase L1-like esterase
MKSLFTKALLSLTVFTAVVPAEPLPAIRIEAGKHRFVSGEPPREFRPWGLNYGNAGRLIEDFQDTEWQTVAGDFAEMKALGANVVRVHLQFGKLMQSATEPNTASLKKLSDLLALAETTGLYLDLTGLACYRTEDVPPWYDALNESGRWAAQSVFWESVAKTCAGHTAVFCYNLMNEPLAPAGKRDGGWYSGKKLGGYDFLQMISLDGGTRSRTEVARQWIRQLTAAIRKHDSRTLITVGLLPTVPGWGHMSGFIPAELAADLDFISGHIYPESRKPNDAIERTTTFSVGKPVVIEETFAMTCTKEELAQYLARSSQWAAGWMMHYDGQTIEELASLEKTKDWSISKALWKASLEVFQAGPPAPPEKPEADFLLRDGDTCVFLGDSITAARGYTKIVEHYTLMRFPVRQVRFYHAGKGGDTASGCLERLERDVFSRGATVVTVALGVNDIGWGMKADAEHRQKYLNGIREIVTRCRARSVRVVICSPAITAEHPDKAESGFLQKMADDGLALAASLGAQTCDLQRGMREVQRRILEANSHEPDSGKHLKLHAEDGVHLNDLGQLAMGYALIKGLGAPADVSSATLDWTAGQAKAVSGCAITDIQKTDDGLTFVRLDEGSPLNLGTFSGLNYRWVPMPEGINRQMMTVTGLPPGEYEVRAGGRALGKVSAGALAAGLNTSSMTANGWEPGGPWDAQSSAVKELVAARDLILHGTAMRERFAGDHPDAAALDRTAKELEENLTALMRRTAKPQPCRLEIKRARQP